MKKITAIISVLMLAVFMNISVSAAELDTVMNSAAGYICRTMPDPQVGAVGGEWSVFALARSGCEVDKDYYNRYYDNVLSYVKAHNGRLSDRKYTEYSRVVTALAAIGINAADVAGSDLTEPLSDYERVTAQGVNGAAWALIALDCCGFDAIENSDAQTIHERYIDFILSRQLDTGGWAIDASGSADVDLTAMSLTALSEYTDLEKVYTAADKAVNVLSAMQNERGGFSSRGVENSESAAQVLVALCELGIDAEDDRFVKNGNTIIDNIMSYACSDGSFSHINGGNGDLMATEQCLYGLCAAKRQRDGESKLFDMSDSKPLVDLDGESWGISGKHADIGRVSIINAAKFSDIAGHASQEAIEKLAARGIINGKSDGVFEPDSTMTRAEYAAITVRSLALPQKESAGFADVKSGDWFYSYINTASFYGIVSGISDTEFNPYGTISRAEAAVMTSRAAALAGININMTDTRDVLSVYTDYRSIPEWAEEKLAFCIGKGILREDGMEIKAGEYVTRAEVAQMLFNMMEMARLI